jgi:hypothetical protein
VPTSPARSGSVDDQEPLDEIVDETKQRRPRNPQQIAGMRDA